MSDTDREDALPSDVSDPGAEAVPDADAQMAELRELARSLMSAVQAMQIQNTRGLELRAAIDDVKAATRAMLVAPARITDSTVDIEDGCTGCGPCECISDRCCLFDIVMTHVRVIDMQFEPGDTNLGLIGPMEVRMFASINGIGAVIPNMFSTLSLSKLINKPGVWCQVNQSIGRIEACKGQPKTITISVDAVEVEEGLVEQAVLLRDEYGTASVGIVMDCCCSVPSTVSVEINLTGGGQGGGAIEAKFSATRICC